jgi:outer membrane protein OmpA-like peptidoglycan-associated protein
LIDRQIRFIFVTTLLNGLIEMKNPPIISLKYNTIVLLVLGIVISHFAPAQIGSEKHDSNVKHKLFARADQSISARNKPSTSTFRETTIKGEWTTYGMGGGGKDLQSPRNHVITFDVSRDNSKIRITYESDMKANATVYTMAGQQLGNLFYQKRQQDFNFQRAGTYKVVIWSHDRDAVGNYVMTFGDGIQNIQRQTPTYWHEDQVSFDAEGGGGSRTNFFSPRNDLYTFEPEQGSVYDVNVQSNGVPIAVAVVDPNGVVNTGTNGRGAGVHYAIGKVQQKGIYRIYVATQEPNATGTYKIEVLGNFTQKPVRQKPQFKQLKEQFSANSLQKEYTISAKEGIIEAIYRSTEVGATVQFTDAYQQSVQTSSNNTSTNRFINQSFSLTKQGDYKLTLKSEDGKAGNYELLLWGNFDKVTSNSLKTTPKPPVPGKTITVNGRVNSNQSTDYTQLTIVFENMETGARIGEVVPNAAGNYTINLPLGQQYSITALTTNNQIASSQNIDLTSVTKKNEALIIKPITVISTNEVGAKLTLNNIFFETGSPILLRKSYAELKRVGAFLKSNPTLKVEIAGHTDNVGDDNSNLALSQNRAKSVLYYLQDQIGGESQLTAKGYGKKEPAASNTTDNGRQQNRRVEFRILGN